MDTEAAPNHKPSDGTHCVLRQRQSIHSHSHSQRGYAPNTETEHGAETKTDSQGDTVTKADDAVKGDPNESKSNGTEMMVDHIVDFSVFENITSGDHCDGKHPESCKSLDRIIAALDYHQFTVIKELNSKYSDDAKKLFVEFCDELYSKRTALNDYIHFIDHHADPTSLEQIKRRLHFQCDSAAKCGATSRHYRDRGDGGVDGNLIENNWFITQFDRIHFMIHHLTELGLRVKVDESGSDLTLDDDDEPDDSHLADLALKKMTKEIEAKREEFITERLDGASNSKFTIQVDQFDGHKGSSRETKRDALLKTTWDTVQDETTVCVLHEFVVQHDVDSECIEDDVVIFNEEGTSNFYDALQGKDVAMDSVRRFLRHERIMGRSFSTGYPLFYWDWYTKATADEVQANVVVSMDMDLRGHSVLELSVKPRFANIKEEVLATGLLNPEQFEEFVIQKAAPYLESDKCRNLKCIPVAPWMGDDPLHFEIRKGDPITSQHIHCVILYCDFTKLCTLFSKSMRKEKWSDDLEDIKLRNAMFFHISKKLKETVMYFGSSGRSSGDWMYGHSALNGHVDGPFFSGVSAVLSLSDFSIGFDVPTSTSKTLEIAHRFAGSDGMMIIIGNQKGNSMRDQSVFNATWISAFAEEDEYLWFGSVYRLSVEGISIISSSRTYRQSIGALFLFGAMSSGQLLDRVEVTKEDEEFLNFCFKSESDSDGVESVAPKEADEFIMDNVYCFRQNMNKMTLDLEEVDKIGSYFQNLLFHGMSKSRDIPKDRTNIFRASIFNLFPNLVEVELVVSYFAFSPLSLLSVLNECVIPPSFKVIKLRDYTRGRKWLKKAFVDKFIGNVKDGYAANGWHIEYQGIELPNTGVEDWIFIHRMNM